MLKSLLLLVGVIVTLASCGGHPHDTVRAKDVATGVVMPVTCDSRFYRAGDTVWVNTISEQVTTITHLEEIKYPYRLFVLED